MNIQTVKNAMFKRAATDDSPNAKFTMQVAEQEGNRQRKPMIGPAVPSSKEFFAENEYPYTWNRARETAYARSPQNLPWKSDDYVEPYESAKERQATAMQDARVFDNFLNKAHASGVTGQPAVDMARKQQAETFAKRITAPGTNQYTDIVDMLIHAGKFNQQRFENFGDTPGYIPSGKGWWDVNLEPGGYGHEYKGQSRMPDSMKRKVRDYYPAMGSTGNARRFANWG